MRFCGKTWRVVLLSFGLLSCGDLPSQVNEATVNKVGPRPNSLEDCPIIEGAEAVLSPENPAIILIGEVHGYIGAPALVKALLCHSQRRGLKTHLALELPKDREKYAVNFIRSDGGRRARQAFLSDSWWLSRGDGRRSAAVFDLIDYARTQYQRSLLTRGSQEQIGLSYFAASSAQITEMRDQSGFNQLYETALSDHLKHAFDMHNPDKMIVLTGNLHAQRGVATFGGEKYRLMAGLLLRDDIMTFNISRSLTDHMKITMSQAADADYDGVYHVVADNLAAVLASPFDE